jgi:hypothetical protein
MKTLPEQPASQVQDDDRELVVLPLRAGRRLGLGLHSFQQRKYWHLLHCAQQRDGSWSELRRLSFPLASAEAFGAAFQEFLQHVRSGARR